MDQKWLKPTEHSCPRPCHQWEAAANCSQDTFLGPKKIEWETISLGKLRKKQAHVHGWVDAVLRSMDNNNMRFNEIPPSGRNIDQCQKVEPQPSFKISTNQGRTSQEGHLQELMRNLHIWSFLLQENLPIRMSPRLLQGRTNNQSQPEETK